ncbi:hypothetical protein CRE_20482 [Caenorhabditis remanei]|uniref:Uncharacterized protein n=1 Tax=Caenorhabditis remanei TaxID=31234 RepID=E3N2T7_CAERE|nr:hypothetical protein CRE_20482 [Caenorhabditis remanei]
MNSPCIHKSPAKSELIYPCKKSKNDKRSEGIRKAVGERQLTSAIRPLHRAVAFACCLSALSRAPLLMRPGPPTSSDE